MIMNSAEQRSREATKQTNDVRGTLRGDLLYEEKLDYDEFLELPEEATFRTVSPSKELLGSEVARDNISPAEVEKHLLERRNSYFAPQYIRRYSLVHFVNY